MNSLLPVAFILTSQIIGSEFTYTVQPGESLTSLSARFGVSVELIAEGNGMTPEARLKKGEVLKIDNRHIVPDLAEARIVVNVPQHMLFWITAGDGIRAFPVAAGRRSAKTPIGEFAVAALETDPTWDVPRSIQEEMRREGKSVVTQVPPGPQNPLGKYWIGLSVPGFGIHGTNVPSSIYGLVTHGCIRLHPDDIAELFPQVEIGIAARIVYEPVLMARIADSVFLEVHTDAYKKLADPMAWVMDRARSEGYLSMLDMERVREVLRRREGIPRDVTRR
jgi:L,D-transpeptidase ErfK/SrfK